MKISEYLIEKILEKPLSILDLGCEYPEEIIYLHKKDIDIDYHGVDKIPFEELLISNNHNEESRYWPEEFIYNQSDILNWIDNNKNDKRKYDMIILSQILHFFNEEDKKVILDFCKKALKKNGIIYIKAHNQLINNSQPYYLNENDMALIKKLFNLVDVPIQHKYSIELIGIKK